MTRTGASFVSDMGPIAAMAAFGLVIGAVAGVGLLSFLGHADEVMRGKRALSTRDFLAAVASLSFVSGALSLPRLMFSGGILAQIYWVYMLAFSTVMFAMIFVPVWRLLVRQSQRIGRR